MGKKKTIYGQCALCRQNKELQLSHIVPHFVGRRMIKTAPGDIRVTNEPNIVAQDIEKHYMLCHDCEELFSAKERWFASNIFNPWQDHKQREFSYDESLTYFIVSLSWRSLYLDLEEYSCDSTFDKEILLTMLRAESIMRDYLLGKRQDVSDIQNHIFFFDRIESASNYDFEKNPSVAMHRSITSYSAYNGDTSFTISNLLGIMIVTFYSMTEQEEWTNTQILNGSGTIAARVCCVYAPSLDYKTGAGNGTQTSVRRGEERLFYQIQCGWSPSWRLPEQNERICNSKAEWLDVCK